MNTDNSTDARTLTEMIAEIDSHLVSTQLRQLCREGETVEKFLETGTVYWHFVDGAEQRLLRLDGCRWVRIRLIYIRSGIYFYTYPDYPDVPEQWSPVDSINAMMLHFEEFCPERWGWPSDWNWETLDGRVRIVPLREDAR